MKKQLTAKFVEKVLKHGKNYKAEYCTSFFNIELMNIKTKKVELINIHEFTYIHCRDFLLSYANGLRVESYTRYENKIPILLFDIYLTVPNLRDGKNLEHEETFSGLSELPLFVFAVEWLIKYREDNTKLSKFWVNKF